MIKKILSLFSFLEKKHKISLLILISLMFLATFFEILSLGMVLPLIGSILSNSISDIPLLNLINNYLGNPDQKLLIIYMLSIIVSIFIIKPYKRDLNYDKCYLKDEAKVTPAKDYISENSNQLLVDGLIKKIKRNINLQ
jgi:hypothetical protein